MTPTDLLLQIGLILTATGGQYAFGLCGRRGRAGAAASIDSDGSAFPRRTGNTQARQRGPRHRSIWTAPAVEHSERPHHCADPRCRTSGGLAGGSDCAERSRSLCHRCTCDSDSWTGVVFQPKARTGQRHGANRTLHLHRNHRLSWTVRDRTPEWISHLGDRPFRHALVGAAGSD